MSENLYKVLNTFNTYLGMTPKYAFNHVMNEHIYITMTYNKGVNVPVSKWNETYRDTVRILDKKDIYVKDGVIHNVSNKGMASIWVHRYEKTNEVKFTLWNDLGIYTNSHLMPDSDLTSKFYAARDKFAGNKAQLFIGSHDVYLSEKLICEAIADLKTKIAYDKQEISEIYDYSALKEKISKIKANLDTLELLNEVL